MKKNPFELYIMVNILHILTLINLFGNFFIFLILPTKTSIMAVLWHKYAKMSMSAVTWNKVSHCGQWRQIQASDFYKSCKIQQ